MFQSDATSRLFHLRTFYALLAHLELALGGPRSLARFTGRQGWPARGVYIFMESEETRTDSGAGPRVVRVGTHALTATSKTKLWSRLSQHRGQARSGGGNHRGSIFRLLVGTALLARQGQAHPSWGRGISAPRDIREAEAALEREVSAMIGRMPFLWLAVEAIVRGESRTLSGNSAPRGVTGPNLGVLRSHRAVVWGKAKEASVSRPECRSE